MISTIERTIAPVLDASDRLLVHRALVPMRSGRALCGANVRQRDGRITLQFSLDDRRRECGACIAREAGA